MGFVSDVLDKVDDCAELYNFLFVDYKIDKINKELNYLDRISDDPRQIRGYFLEFASQMSMPLKVLYIQNIMKYSDKELLENLYGIYQVLLIRKDQVMQNRLNSEPIKFASNVCKIVEDVKNNNNTVKKI